MDTIDDWSESRRAAREDPGQKRSVSPALPSAKAIGERLADFKPHILSVHCYEDVRYPWVQVVFEDMISPDVALRVGDVLAGVAGEEHVYLNSLRPQAVYFLLEPAFDDPPPDLPVERYGASLAEIRTSWGRRYAKA